MKIALIMVIVILLLAGGVFWYLQSTTPSESSRIAFPLTAAQRKLISAVTDDADTVALIPTAAALHAKLLANPITRDPVSDWASAANLPKPWMIGSADIVIWRTGKATRYAVTLDPFRALLARFY